MCPIEATTLGRGLPESQVEKVFEPSIQQLERRRQEIAAQRRDAEAIQDPDRRVMKLRLVKLNERKLTLEEADVRRAMKSASQGHGPKVCNAALKT